MTEDIERMKARRARLAAQLADLDRRIAKRQGVPINEPIPSSTGNPYERETRPNRWIIHCVICDQDNVIATRYPGIEPSICDECYQKFEGDSQAARNEAKRQEKQRAKDGKPPRRKAQRLESDE